MRVTIRDIAQRLNVSHATVSRALNRPNDSLISESTRRRVMDTAIEMGYRPNPAARALVTGKTNMISLWLWSEGIQSTYHATAAHYAQSVLRNEPYELIVNMVGYKTLELAEGHKISPLGVDGIIAHEAAPAIAALFGDRPTTFVPVVCTGTYNWIKGLDMICVDLTNGAFEAIRHLVAPGRSRVAYIATDFPSRFNRPPHEIIEPRFLAYTTVMNDAGLAPEFIECPPGRPAARQTIVEYIRENGCPEAIFCHNDELAIGVYRGLCDLGIRVPDDVAIVGCDGLEDTEYLECPISTIVQPMEQMFTMAWQCLERRIRDPRSLVQETWFRPRLVVRKSSQG